jgi:hypothetical protein
MPPPRLPVIPARKFSSLTVLPGLPLIAADYGMVIPPIDSDDARRKALLERVRKQCSDARARSRRMEDRAASRRTGGDHRADGA